MGGLDPEIYSLTGQGLGNEEDGPALRRCRTVYHHFGIIARGGRQHAPLALRHFYGQLMEEVSFGGDSAIALPLFGEADNEQ